jgi:hypothetical protein
MIINRMQAHIEKQEELCDYLLICNLLKDFVSNADYMS